MSLNKKGKVKKQTAWLLGLLALGVVLFFVFKGGIPQGDIVNGIYDPDTGICEPDPNNVAGFYTCCFNEFMQQVDCNNPSDLITLSIYQGNTGIFFITHGITITNRGNVDISSAWLDSAIWSPSHTELTDAYATVLGVGNGRVIPATDPDTFEAWSTGVIDLQEIGGVPGSPITYDLTLVAKADSPNLPTGEVTKTASMTVEQESIGFDLDIDFGF